MKKPITKKLKITEAVGLKHASQLIRIDFPDPHRVTGSIGTSEIKNRLKSYDSRVMDGEKESSLPKLDAVSRGFQRVAFFYSRAFHTVVIP